MLMLTDRYRNILIATISIKVANITNPYTDDPTFTDFNVYMEKKPE
jgi:hypothetical protein